MNQGSMSYLLRKAMQFKSAGLKAVNIPQTCSFFSLIFTDHWEVGTWSAIRIDPMTLQDGRQ